MWGDVAGKTGFEFVVKSSQLYVPGLIVGVAQGESNYVNNQEFSTMTHMLSDMCSVEEENTSTFYFSII